MNYINTFIAVSPDTTARAGTVPPERGGRKSIAVLEYELISSQPYGLTQEEVQFSVHLSRSDLSPAEAKSRRDELWKEFFSKSMACMRTSPLARSYGWGLHFDADGKVALVGMESAEYGRLTGDSSIEQTRAMRSKRAWGPFGIGPSPIPKQCVRAVPRRGRTPCLADAVDRTSDLILGRNVANPLFRRCRRCSKAST